MVLYLNLNKQLFDLLHMFRMHEPATISALMIHIRIRGIPTIGLTVMEPGVQEKWQLLVTTVYAVPEWRTIRRLPVKR